MKNPVKNLFLTTRFYLTVTGIIFLFLSGFVFPVLFSAAKGLLFIALLILLLDIVILFANQRGISITRNTSERFSLGDPNNISISIENFFPFDIHTTVIDEIPIQFQVRDFRKEVTVAAGKITRFVYDLIPQERGEYFFGHVHVFVRSSIIGFAERRITGESGRKIAVYPSFLQMKKFEIIAFSNQLKEYGIKRQRKIGHTFEFEQIREYVKGDDYRTINWKATARKQDLMVNQFQDEKSQQIYCILDMGRTMKKPYNGISLLDYSINATLVISNIILKKQDKSGVITFSNSSVSVLPAEKKSGQLSHILELLYHQKTNFLESNFENLFQTVRRKVKQRSLLFLFTNFESVTSLKRHLSYFRKLAAQHLLIVVFFENFEVRELVGKPAHIVSQIYRKTIAENFILNKKQIVRELEIHGISTILTTPDQLTVHTINKYLELKSRGLV